MDTLLFNDKEVRPTEELLAKGIGEENYELWSEIKSYVFELYPNACEEWKHTGVKYGWSYRLNDKKRVIVYLLPREDSFLVALSFSEMKYAEVMNSSVNDSIKLELSNARAYVEGRGIRIPVEGSRELDDIKKLIKIKLSK